MFTLSTFIIVASALLPPVCIGLTEQCTKAQTHCTAQQIQDQLNNVEPCTEGQKYYNCLAGAIATAETNGICDTLMVAFYQRQAALDADNYVTNCPVFKTPQYLLLDACGNETGDCGLHIIQAFRNNSTKIDVTALCQSLLEFRVCMEGKTASCSNRTTTEILLGRELTAYQYETTCSKTSTALLSTTKMATPTPLTTSKPTSTIAVATTKMATPIPLTTTSQGGATVGTGRPASNAPASHRGPVLLVLLLLTLLYMQ